MKTNYESHDYVMNEKQNFQMNSIF